MPGVRRANSLAELLTTSPEQSLLTVDRGPGWVVAWTENMGARWRIDSTEDLETESTWVETGPASRARVYVGALGSNVVIEQVLLVLNHTASVDPATGRVTTGLPFTERQRAFARFYPSQARGDERDPHSLVAHNVTRMQSRTTMTVRETIAPGAWLLLGYPQGERSKLTIKASNTVLVDVSGDDPVVKTVDYVATPSTLLTLDVSPLHNVQIQNPHIAGVNVSCVWRDW